MSRKGISVVGALLLIAVFVFVFALQEKTDAYTVAESDLERDMSPDTSSTGWNNQVYGNNLFAFELYEQIREDGENLVFSPYSISLALAMTYAGARGETERQMAETLHFDLPQETLHPVFNSVDLQVTGRFGDPAGTPQEGFDLHVANSLWAHHDYDFLPEFLDQLALNYGAKLMLVDFVGATEEARLAINGWVEDKTEDRIQDLLLPGVLNPITRLVLVNAIYFKAEWLFKFEEHKTFDRDFHLLDGDTVNVPMMWQQESFMYFEDEGWQAIELPYKNERISMCILLPREGAFEQFEADFDMHRLAPLHYDMEYTLVSLTVPKFEFEGSFSLKDALTEMGMTNAFGDADFSGMNGVRELFIQAVIHKAFVAVDEEGTEAAAATGGHMMPIDEGPHREEPVVMRIDRPFIFLIQDMQTGSILFLGRVMNPET